MKKKIKLSETIFKPKIKFLCGFPPRLLCWSKKGMYTVSDRQELVDLGSPARGGGVKDVNASVYSYDTVVETSCSHHFSEPVYVI